MGGRRRGHLPLSHRGLHPDTAPLRGGVLRAQAHDGSHEGRLRDDVGHGVFRAAGPRGQRLVPAPEAVEEAGPSPVGGARSAGVCVVFLLREYARDLVVLLLLLYVGAVVLTTWCVFVCCVSMRKILVLVLLLLLCGSALALTTWSTFGVFRVWDDFPRMCAIRVSVDVGVVANVHDFVFWFARNIWLDLCRTSPTLFPALIHLESGSEALTAEVSLSRVLL